MSLCVVVVGTLLENKRSPAILKCEPSSAHLEVREGREKIIIHLVDAEGVHFIG